MINAYFENIEKLICDRIYLAKTSIQVAVPWFTSKTIFEAIREKLEIGIEVILIILDDEINLNKDSLPFQDIISGGGSIFHTHKDNPLHSKYIIIDEELIITGSYNYTFLAKKRNEENIILTDNSTVINKYIENFERLLEECVIFTNKFHQIDKQRKNIENLSFTEAAFTSVKKNEPVVGNIAPEQNLLSLTYDSASQLIIESNNKELKPNFKAGSLRNIVSKTNVAIGLQSIIDGVEDRMLQMIKVGTQIPCEYSQEFITHEDNQTTMTIRSFYGQKEIASLNTELGFIQIGDIPPRNKGLAKIKVTHKVDEERTLRVTVTNCETNNITEAVYKINSCII